MTSDVELKSRSVEGVALSERDWIIGGNGERRSSHGDGHEGPSTSTLLARFEAVVAANPDKVAVDDGVSRLTYRQVRDSVYDLAARIVAAVPTGQPLLAILRNTISFPVVKLAAICTGRPLIMINATDPLERRRVILEEAGPVTVITSALDRVDLSFLPPGTPQIGFDPQQTGAVSRPEVAVDLDAPASIGFTSGSTGRPKGVVYPLRTLEHLAASQIDALDMDHRDVVLGIAALTAGGAREALAALLVGARLRLIDLKAAGVLQALRVIQDEKVTIISFVPSAMRQIMLVPGIETALASLRALDVGGESLTAADLVLFRSKLPPGCQISVAMGSTEVSLVFRWRVRDEAVEGLTVPVGYLEPGRRISLLDEEGRPASPEQGGEMVAADRHVSLGVWRSGRLESGPIQTDPNDPSIRIYATGDIMRRRPDGLFEFCGRRDRLIKVRGLRVDLGEIEAALRNVPGVADAVAVALQREGDTPLVTAFLVAETPEHNLTNALVRQSVTAETAEHMAPSLIRWVAEIPRLANHKPDLVRLTVLARQADPAAA